MDTKKPKELQQLKLCEKRQQIYKLHNKSTISEPPMCEANRTKNQ